MSRPEVCDWCSEPVPAPWAVYFVPTTAQFPGLKHACESHKDDALAYGFDETPVELEHQVRAEWEPPEGYVTDADRHANAAAAARLVHQPMVNAEWCTCGEWTRSRGGWFQHARAIDLEPAA